MVDFDIGAEAEKLRVRLRSLAVAELRPLAAEADTAGRIPEAAGKILAAADLPGADAFAAGSSDALEFCLAAEALAWGDAVFGYAWVASRQVAWIVAACGTDAQRQRYLPRLAEGPLIPASLLLFEGFGRSPAELATRARREGDDWVVSGTKTAVPFAGSGGPAVVLARDEDGELIGFVIDDPAGQVVYAGQDTRRVALDAVSLADSATIDGLRVGPEAVLNRSGLAAAVAVCRLAQASVILGAAEATTRYAADWGLQRTAFGRPLVGFQGVSFVLADLFMDIEALRATIADAASRAAGEDVDDLTSNVVAHANLLFRDAAREGVELMGVHGVIAEHPSERVFRSATVLTAIDFDPLHEPLKLTY